MMSDWSFSTKGMLGPKEREVRYEALVQRLLSRGDAEQRRIVCLSALFPGPAEMKDLVEWIRQDDPGSPIHSSWRPTRQRFGVIRWGSKAARLEVAVEQEKPFVPHFVDATYPPMESRRQKPFPAEKNELTLAAAWRFLDQEKDVLIYCPIRKSVETLGKLILKCIDQGVLASLETGSKAVQDVMASGSEWLGPNHPAVRCLEHGVALHHGGLPRPYLEEVEYLLRAGELRLTVASPTLAQGLNLSASVLLVSSIWRNAELIPPDELANVAGRAGRAFVDVESLVLHTVWEKPSLSVSRWQTLVAKAKAPGIVSGILALCLTVFGRIAKVAQIPFEELLEYVTGNSRVWDFDDSAAERVDIDAPQWNRDLASLDAAIFTLLDADTPKKTSRKNWMKFLEGRFSSDG